MTHVAGLEVSNLRAQYETECTVKSVLSGHSKIDKTKLSVAL